MLQAVMKRSELENSTIEGDSPVLEVKAWLVVS